MISCCLAQSCACCASQTIHAFGHAIPVNFPRVMHVLIFGATALLSWLCGMYLPAEYLNYVSIFNECSVSGRGVFDIRSCYVSLFVVRAMAALAVWYGVLALLTIHISDASDWRIHIYSGFWGPKTIVLFIMIVISFFLPNELFVGYNWIALVGAAIFIIVQIIVLIDFAYEWASSWVSKMEGESDEYGDADDCDNGYFIALMGTSSAMFIGGLVIAILLYVFFTREYVPGGCSAGGLNAFFITTQIIMSLACMVCSILPAVKERTPDSGLLQSSFIAIYTAYLVTSALLSEPKSWKEGCNKYYTDTVISDSTNSAESNTIVSWYHGISSMERFTAFIGAVITIVAVCYSTFRTSGSTDKLMISDDTTADKASVIAKVADDENGTAAPAQSSAPAPAPAPKENRRQSLPFSFSLFHVAFMLGAMYVQQLLTNWETISSPDIASSTSLQEITVDSGIGSVWAKIISSWLVFILYLWSLFAPILFPDRDFGYGVSYSF